MGVGLLPHGVETLVGDHVPLRLICGQEPARQNWSGQQEGPAREEGGDLRHGKVLRGEESHENRVTGDPAYAPSAILPWAAESDQGGCRNEVA